MARNFQPRSAQSGRGLSVRRKPSAISAVIGSVVGHGFKPWAVLLRPCGAGGWLAARQGRSRAIGPDIAACSAAGQMADRRSIAAIKMARAITRISATWPVSRPASRPKGYCSRSESPPWTNLSSSSAASEPAAISSSGGPEIEVRLVDVSSIAAGEYAENELRKDFTPSERVAILETIERMKEGRSQKNSDPGP